MLFHHGSVTLVDARGDWLRPGSAGIVSRFVVCVGQLAVGAQLWCRVLWWTLFTGSWWLVELLQSLVERISEILTSIENDGDGASCDAASARVIHSENSSGSRIWTCRRSASEQQSRDSSSSERQSESHRCEWPLSSKGVTSLAERRISNSGRRRRRHSSLVWSRSLR